MLTKRIARTIFLLLVLLAVAGMAAGGAPADAAFPGVNGKIAFTSDRDGNTEIYVMNADGTGVTRLTNNALADDEPAWSPDGTRIAFRSQRDGNTEIYAMNADGTGQTNLTNNAAEDWSPAWSPDGTKIVFSSNRVNGGLDHDVWSMNADGSGLARLTTSSAWEHGPAWSPDGAKIAYDHSTGCCDNQLYTMNPDGTGQALLPPNLLPFNAARPDWSPDGQKLAFSGWTAGVTPPQTYLINADGSGGLTGPPAGGDSPSPVFSPDGSKIAFYTSRDGNYEIYVMNADFTGLINLTNDPGNDTSPDWQRLLSVGGLAELPEAAGAPLEAPGSSGGNAGLLAALAAAATAAVITLGGAAWYARRRRVR